MARETRIITEHHLSETGKWGVGFFLISPILSALGYWWLLAQLANEYGTPDLLGSSILLFLGGCLFIASIPMLLMGRFQISTIKRV